MSIAFDILTDINSRAEYAAEIIEGYLFITHYKRNGSIDWSLDIKMLALYDTENIFPSK